MSEICQYTVTVTKEYTFNLLQEDARNMANEVGEVFNPDAFWCDEDTEISRNRVWDIVALSKFNVKNLDCLKIKNDELVEVDDSEEVIEAIRQEKLNKIKEEEFLKKQLKLGI